MVRDDMNLIAENVRRMSTTFKYVFTAGKMLHTQRNSRLWYTAKAGRCGSGKKMAMLKCVLAASKMLNICRGPDSCSVRGTT